MKKIKLSPVKGQKRLSSFFKIAKPEEPKLKDTRNVIQNNTVESVKVIESDREKPKVKDNSQVAETVNDVCLKLNVVSNNAKRKRSEDVVDSALHVSEEKLQNVQKENKDLDDMFEMDSSIFGDFEPWENEITNFTGDLKLETLTRCKVETVEKQNAGNLLVTFKSAENDSSALCKILAPWSSCPINVGDVVSVRAKQVNDEWIVDGSCMLILHSDNLISGTSVVGALFCMRKSILGNMIKDASSSSVMVVGSLVHELLQEVLKQKLDELADIFKLYQDTVSRKEFILRLYCENIDYDKVLEELSLFIPKIHEFVKTYMKENHCGNGFKKESFRDSDKNWKGSISEIKDIEECIWAPSLGLKGKIDATVQVKIHRASKIMPLELKTGRASFSNEHRGQVILYCMLLTHFGQNVDSGLLLYLREGIMKEVKAGEAEKRDLMLLRNQLSHWLARCNVPNIGGPPNLPPPINHHSACSKCPYLTVCSSALRQEGLNSVTDSNPLKKLVPEVTTHLTDAHIEYVFKFMNLILMDRSHYQSLPIWSESADMRESKGAGLSNLRVTHVIQKGNRFEHTFVKIDGSEMKTGLFNNGQYVIINTDERYGISSGFISSALASSLTVLLDRDLSNGTGSFHIDRIETSIQYNIPLSNLSLLLEDSAKAARLREFIVDLKVPKFAPKLSSKINKIGQPIFERLNRDQIRAVLQVLSAEDYILIKGMPGTGKTSTLVALIELLTLLGKTVLVTSYTHSALDNILLGLAGRVDFLRLGSTGRIHPDILDYSEEKLCSPENYASAQELDRLYRSKPVVGVTCLGSWHFLFNKRSFDFCIIDEATQVHQPIVLKPLFSASKFVLIGDPEQLSPLVVNNQAKKELGISLFERLNKPAVTSLLSLQYRMNASLTKLANSLTYNGLLKCGSTEVENATLNYRDVDTENWPEWMRLCLSKELDRSVVVVDVKTSIIDEPEILNVNHSEANIVLQILRTLKQVGLCSQDVGVMSPYKGQVKHLQKEASEIDSSFEIRTIDQYQGRDKKVIIYSCTRSTSPSVNDIMNVPSRLTVAITRAKVKLIIIGNVDLLRGYSSYNKLFNSIPESNFFVIS